MEIKQDLRIQAKEDNCRIQLEKTGKISIGSILINPDEVGEFLAALADALSRIKQQTLP